MKPDVVKVEQVIISTQKRIGTGDNPLSPVRIVTQILDFEGNIIAQSDPCSYSIETIAEFIRFRTAEEDIQTAMEWVQKYFLPKDEETGTQ